MKGYVGETCPECGNFTMVRNGTCLKCDTCGGTTGAAQALDAMAQPSWPRLDPAIHGLHPTVAVPGLDPEIDPAIHAMMRECPAAWVYIMTNRPNGVLYTGVTSDIARRAYEHREGLGAGIHQAVRAQATRLHGSFTSKSPTPFNASRTSSIGLAPGRRRLDP